MTTAPTEEQRPLRHPVPEGTSRLNLLLLMLMPVTVATVVGILAWLTSNLR
jgi:hypothetical protein